MVQGDLCLPRATSRVGQESAFSLFSRFLQQRQDLTHGSPLAAGPRGEGPIVSPRTISGASGADPGPRGIHSGAVGVDDALAHAGALPLILLTVGDTGE